MGLSWADRFWQKVDKTDICWYWTASKVAGYGNFGLTEYGQRAHRIAYNLLVGPIPPGYHIDHLCRNRACVNPDHLGAVTQAENNRRAAVHASRKRKPYPRGPRRTTHCKHGHPITTESIEVNNRGHRICKICTRDQKKERRERKRNNVVMG